jgi:hypothetical protein
LRKSAKNNLFRKRFLIHTSNNPDPVSYTKPFSEVSNYYTRKSAAARRLRSPNRLAIGREAGAKPLCTLKSHALNGIMAEVEYSIWNEASNSPQPIGAGSNTSAAMGC